MLPRLKGKLIKNTIFATDMILREGLVWQQIGRVRLYPHDTKTCPICLVYKDIFDEDTWLQAHQEIGITLRLIQTPEGIRLLQHEREG